MRKLENSLFVFAHTLNSSLELNDEMDAFRTLTGGSRFDRKRFASDMSSFEAPKASGSTLPTELDFFGTPASGTAAAAGEKKEAKKLKKRRRNEEAARSSSPPAESS